MENGQRVAKQGQPKILSVEQASREGITRYRVTFDMEWTNPAWDGAYSAKGLWFDTITCVAKDELDAWQIGITHAIKTNLDWRAKNGEG